MPVFQYKAATVNGDVVQGEMEAVNQDAVIRQLQAEGHIPIRAEEVANPAAAAATTPSAFRFQRRRANRADVNVFTIELATLLQAGLPLDKALEMLVNLSDTAPFRAVLEKLLDDVRGGGFLSAALESHGRLFSRFYRNMVKAGELGGVLELVLIRLAEYSEKAQKLKNKMTTLNLSEEDCARLLGVSRSTVMRWISGSTTPHHIMRQPLLDILDKDNNAI